MSACNGVDNVTRENPCDAVPVRKYVPRRVLEASAEVSKEDVFLRKLKGIFNKLCPKSVDEQINQILETLQEIKTDQLSPQTWNEISKLILQRAIADPNFHQTYLSVCSKIGGQFSGVLVPAKESEENEKEGKEKGLKFGDLFPLAYESELQQRLEIKDADEDLMERMKEKMLNGTRFLGELGKRVSMFTSPANLLPPVTLLLSFLEDPSFPGHFSGIPSMRVECTCTFLNLIGKTVDMNPSDTTERIFRKIQELGENKSLVPRLRFMAKGLSELRSNRWLPRILTKKSDDCSKDSRDSRDSNCTPPAKEGEKRENGDKEMSMEDAELFSAMEKFVQQLNGKSETCISTVMKKFINSITPAQSKLLASAVTDHFESSSNNANPSSSSAAASPSPSPSPSATTPSSSSSSSSSSTSSSTTPPRPDKFFPMRRSSVQLTPKSPLSPLALSRNFHAIINLIKLNNASTISEDINQSLVSKVSTLKASELIEVVGSIFRKMCEMPEEYHYCLNICLTLANNAKTTPHTFQETLETCCQDETALRMFNTQASINTYLQLVGDLEKELGMDVQVVKRCVGNVQNGLYELSDHEALLLSHLEKIIFLHSASSPSSLSSLASLVDASSSSPSPFSTSSLSPPPPSLSPPPVLHEIEMRREQKNSNEEQEERKESNKGSNNNGRSRAGGRGGEGDMWSLC